MKKVIVLLLVSIFIFSCSSVDYSTCPAYAMGQDHIKVSQ